ncbi:hypothetical protein BJX68DRAFT_267623 [Aspergillus pseudodeflectus]|uniref:Secreted protein n=1 Tax=Aspergillus pseudodeflectus TaxID=176178 RepID=A0ABR4KBZ9_9EURO
MRIVIITFLLALLATMAAAQHTVNCWGKAIHPELSRVQEAIRFFEHTIDNVNPRFPAAVHAGRHSCVETYCVHKTSIRYCNDGRTMPLQNIMDSTIVISRECVTDHEGKKVAGGVVDHPDHWSVVVQKDDSCTAESIQDIPGIQNGTVAAVGAQGDRKE